LFCRERTAEEQAPAKQARVQSVLEADKYGSYQPKSRETRDAYAQLLQMVQSRLGDYPTEILYGAAEEVLTVLKDNGKRVRRMRRLRVLQRTTSSARGRDCTAAAISLAGLTPTQSIVWWTHRCSHLRCLSSE
jgi:hypothetical protein